MYAIPTTRLDQTNVTSQFSEWVSETISYANKYLETFVPLLYANLPNLHIDYGIIVIESIFSRYY